MHTEGRGRFDECDIFADVRVGMAIWEGGDPVVRRSKIHDSKQSGVMMFNGGARHVAGLRVLGAPRARTYDIKKGCQLRHRGIVER